MNVVVSDVTVHCTVTPTSVSCPPHRDRSGRTRPHREGEGDVYRPLRRRLLLIMAVHVTYLYTFINDVSTAP